MFYALLSLLFGSAEVLFLEYSFSQFDPVIFMVLFYFFAFGIVLSVFLKAKKNINLHTAKEHASILASYVGFGAIGNALWFTSLFMIGAHGIVLIGIVQRIFILLYSAKFMGEKMSILQYVMSSVIILSTLAFTRESNNQEVAGIVLCAISYLFFAISDIAQKKVANHVDWQLALVIRQGFQFLIFTTIALLYVIIQHVDVVAMININLLISALIASLLGAVLGKATHYLAVKHMALNRVLLIEQLKSFVVFAGAILLFNAVANTVQLAAGMIMIVCVFAINYEDYLKKQRAKNALTASKIVE